MLLITPRRPLVQAVSPTRRRLKPVPTAARKREVPGMRIARVRHRERTARSRMIRRAAQLSSSLLKYGRSASAPRQVRQPRPAVKALPMSAHTAAALMALDPPCLRAAMNLAPPRPGSGSMRCSVERGPSSDVHLPILRIAIRVRPVSHRSETRAFVLR